MKHAIIVAHPNPNSFTAGVAQAYVEAVGQIGGRAIVRDLYAMGFDPCLKTPEIPTALGEWRPGDDVAAERATIGDADVFAFIYPWWFNAPPAILKGYVDRVFSLGFGYAPTFGGMRPLLEGRRLISFSSSGAPDGWIRDSHALDILLSGFDRHLAKVTGLTLVDHAHLGGVVPLITGEAAEAMFGQVREAVRGHFASAPRAA
jgi:NAD(P)H dehydrogenase (quinone)